MTTRRSRAADTQRCAAEEIKGWVDYAPRIDDAFLVAVVVDLPAPQGSKRHVGKGIMVESSARVKPWREAVKAAVLEPTALVRDRSSASRPENPTLVGGPIRIRVTFTLPRPKSHFLPANNRRSEPTLKPDAPPYPAGQPDVDKLLRSTLDAIVAAGVIADDAQIVDAEARKVYPQTHYDALTVPGAVIRMWRL